ncbi:MAG: hypothetical protein ACRDHE_16045 [Ktedonobacterales bacterium]
MWPTSAHASIVQIYQLTVLQAAALTDGECTGLPDGNPVFVVTLTGDIASAPIPGVTQATMVHSASEVFDGLTGALIEPGNLPK